MKKLICALILLLCTSPLLAKSEYGIGKKDKMGVCNSDARGSFYIITNTSVADSCDASLPVGDEVAVCFCKEDAEVYAWAALANYVSPDLSSYVTSAVLTAALADYALLDGDADGQTIQGVAGADKARIDLQSTSAALYSSYAGAAESSSVLVETAGITLESEDTHSSALRVAEAGISIVSGQTPPTNANDACTAGDFIPTSGFIYFCVATNTWQRVAIATWP